MSKTRMLFHTCWKGAAAECIGPLHIKQRMPMQDSHKMYISKNIFIAVVADGLGSKANSDFGSKTACKVFINTAKKWIKNKMFACKGLKELIEEAHKLWLEKINKSKYEAKNCATTLLAAVCNGDSLFLFRLGDGMIVCINEDSTKNFVLSDSKDESFSNITKCLNENSNVENWEIKEMSSENLKSIFLATDGISDDLQDGNHLDFVSDLTAQYHALSARKIKKDMNHWITHWSVPRHSDDKTAVFICKRY